MFLFLTIFGISEELNPVILMPGLYGSQLYASYDNFARHWYCPKKLDDDLLWVDAKYVIPPLYNCLFEMLSGYYNPETGNIESQPGIDVYPYDFGGELGLSKIVSIGALDVMDSFEPMFEYLKHKGYVVGKNLFGCPYDWRLAVPGLEKKGFFDDLQGLIEKAYTYTANKKVTILGYSLGGMMISQYLGRVAKKEFVDKYIRSAIFLAPAFGGSGETLPVAWDLIFPIVPFISNDIISETIMNMPVIHALFPNHVVFQGKPIIRTPEGKDIGPEGLIDFLSEHGKLKGDALKMARMNEEISKKAPADPQVPTVIIYNDAISTNLALNFVNGYNKKPEISITSGDGTVPAEGPKWGCENWNKKSNNALVCVNVLRPDDDFNHVGLGVHEYIHELIYNYTNQDDWKNQKKSIRFIPPYVGKYNSSRLGTGQKSFYIDESIRKAKYEEIKH